ncbi:MAG TPA: Hsp20/alpha crystallin family protein [Candidatus Magasanikbacteria bacterium]|nr:Hsp20/alpha crystallin family protein [Candidatus Magasanikbacteria bacterium]
MSDKNTKNNEADILDLILESQHSEQSIATSDTSPSPWGEDEEGQLAVDVYETERDIVVASTMAGAVPEKIEVYVHNELLTIRGVRYSPSDKLNIKKIHCTECFWGKFSRTIVLPTEVKGDLARAEFKNGVMVVRIPKRQFDAKIPVVIVDE